MTTVTVDGDGAAANLIRESESLIAIEKGITTTNAGLDVFYLLFAGTLVFFMQAGFAMLCAGSIRAKNVKNIMLKNILDACVGAIVFWTIGYALAYGGQDSTKVTFIGNADFALANMNDGGSFIGWFFQFAFAATAATIVAGTVAERCKFEAYIAYSLALTGFVYPVVVHSIWSSSGFLSAFTDNKFLGSGMIDFAGSGVVHMTGGSTALCAAKILGPRIGRFYDRRGNELDEPGDFPPHSVPLQVIGTFILWVGWYGFNPGSTLAISPAGYGDVAALCAVTTTIAATAGSVSAMFTESILERRRTGLTTFDITFCMNGALSGLVGITAGCSVVEPWAAFVIGIIAGWVYIMWSYLLVQLKIDDAVDAIPVHFGNGIWGCIATGLFASPGLVKQAYGTSNYGWFYNWGMGNGTAKLLAIEIIGVLFIIGWTGLIMIPYFCMLNLLGLFRVDEIEEIVGLDIAHHNGSAYNLNCDPKQDSQYMEKTRRSL